MIRLTRERLTAALSRLSQSEQDELLTLLEQERVEVETEASRWTEIEATRPPIESFMRVLSEEDQAFYDRHDVHLTKLLRQYQARDTDALAWMQHFGAAWNEATELTVADGYPDPCAPKRKDNDPADLLADVLDRTEKERVARARKPKQQPLSGPHSDAHDPLEHYRSKPWLIDAPHPDE
jgi:hypothetical protein